jgi:hypothetical protein
MIKGTSAASGGLWVVFLPAYFSGPYLSSTCDFNLIWSSLKSGKLSPWYIHGSDNANPVWLTEWMNYTTYPAKRLESRCGVHCSFTKVVNLVKSVGIREDGSHMSNSDIGQRNILPWICSTTFWFRIPPLLPQNEWLTGFTNHSHWSWRGFSIFLENIPWCRRE